MSSIPSSTSSTSSASDLQSVAQSNAEAEQFQTELANLTTAHQMVMSAEQARLDTAKGISDQ